MPRPHKRTENIGFQLLAFAIVTVVAFFALLPFLLLVMGSITGENEIVARGYTLFPREISFESYTLIFKHPQEILRAYLVTIVVTLTGTLAALLLTSLTAYVLARRDFKYRNFFSLLFFFTSMFYAPLVANYIYTVNVLGLKNSPLVYLIGGLLSPWYVLIMRNFIKSLPEELIEAAKIDGANDAYIYAGIIMPLLKPALATVGLFVALGYWNDWSTTMLYIDKPIYYNLQYYLYRIINNQKAVERMIALGGSAIPPSLPTQAIKMAMAVVTIGPIVFLYPFLQRFFVQGLTVGAVKG